MGRSWISDHESTQGHFALVYPVPMDSQDHFRMIRSHNIAMPSKWQPKYLTIQRDVVWLGY